MLRLLTVIHCTFFTMRANSTPDSAVPSLAESSQASTVVDDVTRVLFDIDTPEQFERTSTLRVHCPKQDEDDSDATVASFTMSIDDTSSIVADIPEVGDLRVALQKAQTLDSPADSDKENQGFQVPVNQSASIGDDVPREPSYLSSLNLSPVQLAGIFDLFDTSRRQRPRARPPYQTESAVSAKSPSRSPPSEASTTLTSNMGAFEGKLSPRVQSLEHECSTLKQILQVDSENILKLKTEQEKLREQSSEHVIEIRLLKLALDTAKREKELQQERESQHLETNKILKKELDKLTTVGSALARKKIEQMRLENELFASQIIENEVEMREIHSSLEMLAAENARLRSKLQPVASKAGVKPHDKVKITLDDTASSETGLAKQVESLAARLVEIENRREQSAQLLEEEDRRREKELEGLKKMMLSIEMASKDEDSVEENEAQEVEVTLDGPMEIAVPRPPDESVPTKAQSEDTTFFCDCFPTHSSTEV
jgi:hypothetical protein